MCSAIWTWKICRSAARPAEQHPSEKGEFMSTEKKKEQQLLEDVAASLPAQSSYSNRRD